MDQGEELDRTLHAAKLQAVAHANSDGCQKFEDSLKDGIAKVLKCEDELCQGLALSLTPLDNMLASVQDAISLQQQLGDVSEFGEQDLLAQELLKWFKHQFFTWVDCAKCHFCSNASTHGLGMAPPSSEELQYGAGRVELYHCALCYQQTRFPRYNSVEKLLETRCGRCGEWANAFMLFCRAVGLDARYVMDWTDHVWVEYYSDKLGRWVHMDPCEASFDHPLLYEVGWGKQLTYLVAIHRHGVTDVTRRYTRNFAQLLPRRVQVPELWLVEALRHHTEKLRGTCTPEEKQQLEQRDRNDAQEMEHAQMTPATDADLALPGRQTGSNEWRQQRGETGTKWLDFGGAGESGQAWLEYRLVDPPGAAAVLTHYDLVSANDFPDRDPQDWVLEGLPAQPESSLSSSSLLKSSLPNSSGATPHSSPLLTPQPPSPQPPSHSPPPPASQPPSDAPSQSPFLTPPYSTTPVPHLYPTLPLSSPCYLDPSHSAARTAVPHSTSATTQDAASASTQTAASESQPSLSLSSPKWIVLDTRSGIMFHSRHELRTFLPQCHTPCSSFRLTITRSRQPQTANCMQLACWSLYSLPALVGGGAVSHGGGPQREATQKGVAPGGAVQEGETWGRATQGRVAEREGFEDSGGQTAAEGLVSPGKERQGMGTSLEQAVCGKAAEGGESEGIGAPEAAVSQERASQGGGIDEPLVVKMAALPRLANSEQANPTPSGRAGLIVSEQAGPTISEQAGPTVSEQARLIVPELAGTTTSRQPAAAASSEQPAPTVSEQAGKVDSHWRAEQASRDGPLPHTDDAAQAGALSRTDRARDPLTALPRLVASLQGATAKGAISQASLRKLVKIICNLREHSTERKFRRLRVSKLGDVMQVPEAVVLLALVGFRPLQMVLAESESECEDVFMVADDSELGVTVRAAAAAVEGLLA